MQINSGTYPLVSVAICTYNGALYLTEQLNTIIDQTYPNLEIVIADDASTDDTINIIKRFLQRDSRIKLYCNEKNLGYNKNFEKVFSLCQGDFIAIADQDDVWESHKIEYMMNAWPEDSSFIYSLSGTFTNSDFDRRKSPPPVLYDDVDNVHKLVFNSPVHGHACMFKKDLLPLCMPFPTDIYYDWWMSMHAAATGTIGFIPQVLTWHRFHESNHSPHIISIKDKEVNHAKRREQIINVIETICSKGVIKEADKESLLQYVSILKKMDGKRFSWPMFRYVFKNRKLVFYYKKQKPLIMLSYIKHAFRMGYKGFL